MQNYTFWDTLDKHNLWDNLFKQKTAGLSSNCLTKLKYYVLGIRTQKTGHSGQTLVVGHPVQENY